MVDDEFVSCHCHLFVPATHSTHYILTHNAHARFLERFLATSRTSRSVTMIPQRTPFFAELLSGPGARIAIIEDLVYFRSVYRSRFFAQTAWRLRIDVDDFERIP